MEGQGEQYHSKSFLKFYSAHFGIYIDICHLILWAFEIKNKKGKKTS